MFSKSLYIFAMLVATVTALPSANKRATCSGGQTTANDACCVWFDVLDDLQTNLFHNGDCGEEAHESLRLIFHDAIAISPALTAQGKFGGGGSDGSIMAHADVEAAYQANAGLDEIIEAQRPFALKHNVSFGDFDSRTSCEWQRLITLIEQKLTTPPANPDDMVVKFVQTVKKLSLLGFDESSLTDCSDVIPVPSGSPAAGVLPAGKSLDDIDASCSATPFPTISALPDNEPAPRPASPLSPATPKFKWESTCYGVHHANTMNDEA
ncbi:heme peroxidase [Trametes gibbosa]|nr:heme peroxidase [Trametes gibbosa]